MIFKIFSPKYLAKKMAFLTRNKGKVLKNVILTLVFEKNAIFFAENYQKSQKIVIIISTPGPGRRQPGPASSQVRLRHLEGDRGGLRLEDTAQVPISRLSSSGRKAYIYIFDSITLDIFRQIFLR
jgi:hypothetical protein